jgi:hypothetical protein
VTNALSSQNNGIIELFVVPRVAFAAVEVHVQSATFFLSLLSCSVDLVKEVVDVRSEVLLIDHIEAHYHVREVWRVQTGIKLSLNVILPKNLEAACDDPHLENGELFSDGLLHSLENGDFFFERNWAISVEDHAEDVLPLDHGHILSNQSLADVGEDPFEKLNIVV